jgi:hypothetical protein
MTLNGTLVAQAINFCIAYCILRWLYFKPAIAQIKHDEALTKQVKNAIAERVLTIGHKQQQQKEYWLECQHYCQERMPSVQKPMVAIKSSIPALEQVRYDVTQLKQLSDTVTDMLVQRIEHVS